MKVVIYFNLGVLVCVIQVIIITIKIYCKIAIQS